MNNTPAPKTNPSIVLNSRFFALGGSGRDGKPTVDVYDALYAERFPKTNGQFVSGYYAATIATRADGPLSLDGGIPEWTLDANAAALLKGFAIGLLAAANIESPKLTAIRALRAAVADAAGKSEAVLRTMSGPEHGFDISVFGMYADDLHRMMAGMDGAIYRLSNPRP